MAVATAAVALEVTYSGGGLMMAKLGPVCVALWQTKPTRALFEIQRKELAATVREHPGTAAFICVIQPSADPPDQEIRNASTEMIVKHGRALAAVACVIEGTGFRAAITRTVLTGIVFVIRNPSPFRFFESVEAASEWLGSRLGKHRVLGLSQQITRERSRLSGAEPRATMTG